MTPRQLRAFAAVVRLGSVKLAAAELAVSEAAVSLHVGELRKEFDDQLFTRTGSGLAFTPGGLRLASRSAEMLGLQDRIRHEVNQARQGRRLLRIASSSLFAEYAAPGVIPLFVGRADDLDVELNASPAEEFVGLLESRAVDVAIGPAPTTLPEHLVRVPFLNYRVAMVVGPAHPLAGTTPRLSQLREQTWFLGPSATGASGAVPAMLKRLEIPEAQQHIFQSHAAALEETKRHIGVALAVSFSVTDDLAKRTLVELVGPGLRFEGVWTAVTLPWHTVPPAAAEFTRFLTTPRATQAMLHGAGVQISHFRPALHVAPWT